MPKLLDRLNRSRQFTDRLIWLSGQQCHSADMLERNSMGQFKLRRHFARPWLPPKNDQARRLLEPP